MADKIEARAIIQIAGKPVENVAKALDLVSKKLKEEKKNFKALEVDIIEPELDEETSLYSGLIECLVRFDDVEKALEFILDYTPNSIEVEKPENLKLDANALTAILNDMSSHFLKMNNKLRHANAMLHHLNDQLKAKEKK